MGDNRVIRLRPNIITNTDSYKYSHRWQWPEGIDSAFHHLLSRGGLFGKVMSFGHQWLGHSYLTDRVTMADIEEAQDLVPKHGLPFDRDGWVHIVEKHEGKLPIRIKVLPEGTMTPTGVALATVESTDPEAFWLPGHLEDLFVRLWFPQTVATLSHFIKRDILEALVKSANDPLAELPFKLHDFGARGTSSLESAGVGGMAHLVNFKGTDTIEGLRYARAYYDEDMAGFSIPAMEHAAVTSHLREHEISAFRQMMSAFLGKGKIIACVSDSYDIYNAVRNIWGEELRDEVKESGGTLVIRPDSGKAVEVVLNCLRILEDKVGMEKNLKGYKVLPPYFRLIQGDGVNRDSIREILDEMLVRGYSASNIAFGMGGALLQKLDRDTQKFAYKCSEVTVHGESRKVFKDPVTDPGKRSMAGRLDVIVKDGKLTMAEGEQRHSEMITVYENGEMFHHTTFADVRKRADQDLGIAA